MEDLPHRKGGTVPWNFTGSGSSGSDSSAAILRAVMAAGKWFAVAPWDGAVMLSYGRKCLLLDTAAGSLAEMLIGRFPMESLAQ